MPVYSAYDETTFVVIEGASARYLDLLAANVVFDPAMMAAGFDDSGWSVGAQPFLVPGSRFVGSTWDDVGIEYGQPIIAPLPSGYVSPNGDRWSGTVISQDFAGTSGYVGYFGETVAEVAARITYHVPSGFPAPYNATATSWLYTIAIGSLGWLDIWLDGVKTDLTESGSGRSGRHLFSPIPDSVVAPGAHTLAFHAASPGSSGVASFLASVMLGAPSRLGKQRLRQFPRDDALGGTPRQGRTSRSVQGSARQGFQGTYR